MSLELTLREGQQQQWRQTRDNGCQQQHPPAAKAVHRHTQEDAGQSSSQHTQKIAEVEVWRVDMQVTREAVLDSCANEAVGPQGEHFYLNQN